MQGLTNLKKSKRFWTAIIGLFLMVAVEFAPGLADNAAQIQDTVLIIVGLLIGGYSLQDAAASYQTGTTKYEE